MPLQIAFALGTNGERPPEAAEGGTFGRDKPLLACLQRLRERAAAEGRGPGKEGGEALGYHPASCDVTGQCPLIGNRYKLRNENYDLCEDEYVKPCPTSSGATSRSRRRASASCAAAAPSGTSGTASSPPTPPPAAGPAGADGRRRRPAEVVGARGGGVRRGKVGAEALLTELRRAAPAEAQPSELALRALGGGGDTPTTTQLMALYREVSESPRAVAAASAPPPPAARRQGAAPRCGVATDGGVSEALRLPNSSRAAAGCRAPTRRRADGGDGGGAEPTSAAARVGALRLRVHAAVGEAARPAGDAPPSPPARCRGGARC